MSRPSAEELYLYAAGALDEEDAWRIESELRDDPDAAAALTQAKQLHASVMHAYEQCDRNHDLRRQELLDALPPVVSRPAGRLQLRAGNRLLRIAALIALAVGGAWWMTTSQQQADVQIADSVDISAERIRQEAANVQLVLQMTSDQLQRVQHAAVDNVVGGQVAPAVDRIYRRLSVPPAGGGRI